MISGDYVGDGIGNKVLLWASSNGICVGRDGGVFENLTDKHYRFPVAKTGISFFRQKRGINQYIISLKDATQAENIYE
jgi:hypothetical protein